MSLYLGLGNAEAFNPEQRDEIETQLAAIQTWSGKTDGIGKWSETSITQAELYFTDPGNVWVWTSGADFYGHTYTSALLGDVLIVSWWIVINATLPTGTGTVYLKIPRQGRSTRYQSGLGWGYSNSVFSPLQIQAPKDADTLTLGILGGTAFTAGTIYLVGQIALSVTFPTAG